VVCTMSLETTHNITTFHYLRHVLEYIIFFGIWSKWSEKELTLTMCTSLLNATIAEAEDLYKMNTTSVSHTYLLLCVINVAFNVSCNVAFNVSCNVAFNVSCNVAFNVSFLVMLHLMFLLMFLVMFLLMFLFNGHVMNHFKFHCLCNIMWFTLSLLMTKVCREVDAFF
jgi:hypothetical protein